VASVTVTFTVTIVTFTVTDANTVTTPA